MANTWSQGLADDPKVFEQLMAKTNTSKHAQTPSKVLIETPFPESQRFVPPNKSFKIRTSLVSEVESLPKHIIPTVPNNPVPATSKIHEEERVKASSRLPLISDGQALLENIVTLEKQLQLVKEECQRHLKALALAQPESQATDASNSAMKAASSALATLSTVTEQAENTSHAVSEQGNQAFASPVSQSKQPFQTSFNSASSERLSTNAFSLFKENSREIPKAQEKLVTPMKLFCATKKHDKPEDLGRELFSLKPKTPQERLQIRQERQAQLDRAIATHQAARLTKDVHSALLASTSLEQGRTENTQVTQTSISIDQMPINPIQPVDPVQSVHPVQSVQPVKLVPPVRSIHPVQLVRPAQQILPALPVLSIKSAAPAQVASPEAFQAGQKNLVHQQYFDEWGTADSQSRKPAQIRTVQLSNFPSSATSSQIAALVYGGVLEKINVDSSKRKADVTFLKHEDCLAYYKNVIPGIRWPNDDFRCIVSVEMSDEVDPVNGTVQGYIDREMTRVIRAVGVSQENWTMDAAVRVAKEKVGTGHKLEAITIGNTVSGACCIVWRFCNIADAVSFRGLLLKDDEWEPCNIQFQTDPCAVSTGTGSLKA